MSLGMYDAVIIGGGPAGLTAAIYLARARYRVVVVEKEHFGGQITITDEVVNYPGVLRATGKELTETMRKQAQSFGAEFMIAEAQKIENDGDIKKVVTDKGVLETFAVLAATGAHPRSVGFEGEETYKGHGIAYCATCDGEFFTGREVFVIGGGFAAAEESIFLAKYASHVTILIRGDDFSCAKTEADAARAHEKITVITNTEVVEARGDGADMKSLIYRNRLTGETTEYTPADGGSFGVFVFVGYAPESGLVKGIADTDDKGYIITDRSGRTSAEGIFAAGDICQKELRQVVTAAGDGAAAATAIEKYAAVMQAKTGIKPSAPTPAPQNENASEQKSASTQDEGLFDSDMLAQLNAVFDRMEGALELKLYLDDSDLSKELHGYMSTLAELTYKLSVSVSDEKEERTPCVRVYKSGTYTGLAFHGVPGGHEFTSFVLGLYNASGEGQKLDDSIKSRIAALGKTDITVMVSLTCTMCPELVTAAQKIASMNDNVTAEVYDIAHYADMRDKYRVMSVPCMLINGGKPHFGRKNISALLDIIELEALGAEIQ
ncbi:MAG: FAD-dependent oxidoreductase [Oscillospiraceae bacterium]|nr:FAD-dependent oxidoreductase [Oscillospiraceae bacterium]